MKSLEKISILVAVLILLSASLNYARAQTEHENMKTFFNLPAIRIQVDATAETKPTQNMTFTLSLIGQGEVSVKSFIFNIYGFLYGQDKTLMYSISDNNFQLGTRQYRRTFPVPDSVWGIAYGEISLTYDVRYPVGPGWQVMPYNITFGFTMTKIENVYLKLIEEQLANIRSFLNELNQTFYECFGKNLTTSELLSLNQTYWQFKREYESLKGVKSELDNTRTTMILLAVIAVFFVATTAYLVLRRPKSYW